MAFTNELTTEQIAQIPTYRQIWQNIALSTHRINVQEATTAVQATYELLELKAPEIYFFESPYAAANAAKNLYQSPSFSQDGFVHATKLIDKLHDKFYTQSTEAIGHWDAWVESQLELNASSEIDTQLSHIPQVFERILLKAGAQYGDWKGTELFDAAKYGNMRLINRLAATGVDLDKIDTEDGLTCLMKATQNSQPWAMRALIKLGANVNLTTEDGKTALYFTDNARQKHPVLKKILLKAGAIQ